MWAVLRDRLIALVGIVGLASGLIAFIFGQVSAGFMLTAVGLLNIGALLGRRWIERRAVDQLHHRAYIFSAQFQLAMVVIALFGVTVSVLLVIRSVRSWEESPLLTAIGFLGAVALLALSAAAGTNVFVARRLRAGYRGRFVTWWFPGWREAIREDEPPDP
jgi:cytochrome bd-type quinol oxidase subunit 2